jgi:hypothetical protein
MPTETAIAVAVILVLFCTYAGSLVWADFYSRDYRQHPES